jgi:hypothetical protein
VSSKKVIIMSSPAGPLREGVPPDPSPSVPNRGSEADLQLQIGYLLAEIRESLGELRNAAKVSDDARKINDERILQLIERTTRVETQLPALRDTVERNNTDLEGTTERHATDLNGLGKVAHTADRLIKIAYAIAAILAGPLFWFLHDHVSFTFK